MSVVYIIQNTVNERYYLGSTKDIKVRWKRHKRELAQGNHHNAGMQNDYNAGHEFIIKIVFESESRDEAYREELHLISSALEDPRCYNIGIGSRGGDNLSRNPRRSTIVAKMGENVRKQIAALTTAERKEKFGRCGEHNGMYGRTHTEETRAKLSSMLKGKGKGIPKGPFSIEHRKKLSAIAKLRTGKKNPFYGKEHTEVTRAKLSKARLGKKPSNSMRIIIEGVIYESFTDAGRQLGLNTTVVRWRVMSKNPKYVNWRFVDECPENIESVPRTKKEQ